MTDDKRPTVRMSPEDHKKLKMFCLENDISLQEFLKFAVEYCMKNKILPKIKK